MADSVGINQLPIEPPLQRGSTGHSAREQIQPTSYGPLSVSRERGAKTGRCLLEKQRLYERTNRVRWRRMVLDNIRFIICIFVMRYTPPAEEFATMILNQNSVTGVLS